MRQCSCCAIDADLVIVGGVGSQACQLGDVDDGAGVICIECCSIQNQAVTIPNYFTIQPVNSRLQRLQSWHTLPLGMLQRQT